MYNLTINQAFSFYNDSCKSSGVKESSIKINSYARKRLIEFLECEDTELDSIDRFTFRKFFLWLVEEKKLSSSTAARTYDTLNAMFNFLANEELIEVNPLARVEKPRRNTPPIQPLTVEDVQKLIDACNPKTFTGLRNRLVISLLFDSGMRATELCSVNTADVNLEQKTILLRITKTGVPRPAYFSGNVARLLTKYMLVRKALPGDRLIVTGQGTEVDRYWLRKNISRIGKAAGVKAYPHLLRHSCAVNALKNGSNIVAVMRLLGHTNPRMTLHYSQLADSDVQEIHAQTSPADRLIVGKSRRKRKA